MPDSKFKSLTEALGPWFEKSFAELPQAVQDRVKHDDLILAQGWDAFSPSRRHDQAMKRDLENDPANRAGHEKLFELWPKITLKIDQLGDEIRLVEEFPPSLEFSDDVRELRLKRLRQRLQDFEVVQDELLSAGPAELHDVLKRLNRLRDPRNNDRSEEAVLRSEENEKREKWRQCVEAAGSILKAKVEWARGRYGNDPPARGVMLADHRNDFGKVRGIFDMRDVRDATASDGAKKGGRPTHR